MWLIALVIAGYVVWQCCQTNKKSEQNKADKEFEDINLSLKDKDDDFDSF